MGIDVVLDRGSDGGRNRWKAGMEGN